MDFEEGNKFGGRGLRDHCMSQNVKTFLPRSLLPVESIKKGFYVMLSP